MNIGGFVKFLNAAWDLASADAESTNELDESPPSHHRRIVHSAVLFGLLGAALSIFWVPRLIEEVGGDFGGKRLALLLLVPTMLFVTGLLLGASLGCLFAPRAFLVGPIGSRWLRLVGTSHLGVARATWLLVSLLAAAFLISPLLAPFLPLPRPQPGPLR